MTTTFPTQMPSDFGLYSMNGNAAASSFCRKVLSEMERFLDPADAEAETNAITRRLVDLGHSEATDTVVRECLYSVLTGEAHEYLGLAS